VIDLAIVGGGAAGVAAARAARKRGLSAVIFEASDRIGGRAYTIEWRGQKLDLGATWMHSADRNPLAALASELGVPIDRAASGWRNQFRDLGFSKTEQAQSWAAVESFAGRLREGQPDDRASAALEPGNEWNGFIEALNGYLNGTSLAKTSASDFIAYWDAADRNNWRLPGGYGALVLKLVEGLEVHTSCPIRSIDSSGGGVRLTSDDGVIEARHAIVALPTDVLARGDIEFVPALDDRRNAAAQLPLGRVEKLFFALADPESVPMNAHVIGKPRAADTGSYMLRPLGLPVIEGFFGGDWLDGVDGDDLAAKGREELGSLLGSDFLSQLSVAAYSDWKHHPFICGSYSYARPGHHSARALLRAPVDGPLAFAGEACSDSDYATVHAAWQSGEGAVAQLFGA
jgi:monoamine oxidase